jgi:hypothetical protein
VMNSTIRFLAIACGWFGLFFRPEMHLNKGHAKVLFDFSEDF